jgi:tungstate transport system permease protein
LNEIIVEAGSAVGLLLHPNSGLLGIIAMSLGVSLAATAIAALIGLPWGAVLAVYPVPGRRGLVMLANALLGLPPVVVGLALYLLLSRAGPLGSLGILFTPGAMIAAQALLALPIVTALGHNAVAAVWQRYGNDFLALGLTRLQSIPHLFRIGRNESLTAVLAGFGRSISEVGAILIVGGNIAGHTRTMTTAITLETSQGHLAYAMALGVVLIIISVGVSSAAFVLSQRSQYWQRRVPR